MSNLIGQRIGSYQIVGLLGKGGMANVYRAQQTLGGGVTREVALKLIDPRLSLTPEFIARFRREAQTLVALSHPHILKAFDFGEYEDSVYLVMEQMTGGSLADLIRSGPLSFDTILRLLDQIGSALDYAHRHGIIHRDLKPHNVLLDSDGNGYLTDFGIVKLMNETSALTHSNTAIGTPAYMAPEQWMNGTIDARADLYSLGIMLFEMVSGRVPFQGDTPYRVMHLHVSEAPPSVLSYRPDAPAALDQVIAKAAAKEPSDRYESGAALMADVRAALMGVPLKAPLLPANRYIPPPRVMPDTGTRPLATPPAVPLPTKNISGMSPTPARGRLNPVLMATGIGIVAVILVGLGVILANLSSSKNASTPTSPAAIVVITTVAPTSIQQLALLPTNSPDPTSLPPTATVNTATLTNTIIPPSPTVTVSATPTDRPSATLYPTYTPYPTYTLLPPTSTPRPTQTAIPTETALPPTDAAAAVMPVVAKSATAATTTITVSVSATTTSTATLTPTATTGGCPLSGVVRVASETTFPPFEYIDPKTTQITGFDVDLLTAVGKAQGFTPKFSSEKFDAIFAKLVPGQYELAASAITITIDRAKIVTFSNPYFVSSQAVVLRQADVSKYKSLDSLQGLKIGVQKGTTGADLAATVKKAVITGYDFVPQALQALSNRSVDAVIVDTPTGINLIAANPSYNLTVADGALTTEKYGIAARNDCGNLLNKINSGLNALIADGTYNALYRQYFGQDAPTAFLPSNATAAATAAVTAAVTSDNTVTATVTQKTANMRRIPSVIGALVKVATQNQVFPVVGRAGSGTAAWYLVTLPDGTQAWLSAVVVTLSPANAVVKIVATLPAPTPVPTPVPTATLYFPPSNSGGGSSDGGGGSSGGGGGATPST